MKQEREALEAIAAAAKGRLLVDDVLEAARDESSPLHKHFEWDDTKAAEAFRREQARNLIQRCHITVLMPEPTNVRAFVQLSSEKAGYRHISDVLGTPDARRQLLEDIASRVAYWRAQAHTYGLTEIAPAIDRFASEVGATAKALVKPGDLIAQQRAPSGRRNASRSAA